MRAREGKEQDWVFQASRLFVAVFYGLLVVWTVGTVPLIWLKFQRGSFQGDWLFAVMIGFFYLYTWYWALGLFYRISLDAGGVIRLSSLRRALEVPAEEVRTIEGSRFSEGFGFIKMKLPRESAYLFCHRRDGNLQEVLRQIGRMNPLVRSVRI